MHTNLLVVTELVVSRTQCKFILQAAKVCITKSDHINTNRCRGYITGNCSRKFVQIRKCKTEKKSQSTDDQNRHTASDVRSLQVIAITKATSQSAN